MTDRKAHVAFGVRVPADIAARLSRTADEHGVSRNAVIVDALRRALAGQGTR